jgi:rRNA maturation protein Rpf1
MSLTLRTDFGCTEAIIDDDCGLKRFYEVANILTEQLAIRFTQKQDDFDTLTWNFLYKGLQLILHYNIYTGISIYPFKAREARRKENEAVVEVARFLESKLLVHSARYNIEC